MKTINYKLEDGSVYDSLSEKDILLIQSSNSVLIQLFSSKSRDKIVSILQELNLLFPHAVIIGTTTDGEIYNDEILLNSAVLSISIFTKTQLKSTLIELHDSFQAGVAVAAELVSSQTKLLLTFADGIFCNGDEYLNGIYSIAPNVKVAGGLAADRASFKSTYVMNNTELVTQAVVAVALDSEELKLELLYSFGWQEIGMTHTVTKVEGTRVYEIDDTPVCDFYAKYLGKEVSKDLPGTGKEFPLMVQRNGVMVARAPRYRYKDDSLDFTATIFEGESVRLGIGNASRMLCQSMDTLKKIPSESFFIYSCMARRHFMPKIIKKELSSFAYISTTSGFFTYGEFFTDDRPRFFNETLTAVALSEDQNFIEPKYSDDFEKEMTLHDKTFTALSHLIHQITEEYNRVNESLHRKIDLVTVDTRIFMNNFELLLETMSEGVVISDSTNHIIDANKALSDIVGYTKEELLTMSISDIVSFKSIENIQENLLKSGSYTFEAEFENKNGERVYAIVSSNSKEYEDDHIRISTIVDISAIKKKDNQMLVQSRMAQMGEMINMIAHQWRQPLNSISAAAIKMNMKNELGLLDSEEIIKSTTFIEEMTQKMSKTINDFMSFNKQDREKERVTFEKVVEDTLSLVGAQLSTHSVEVKFDVQDSLTINTYINELVHVLINLLINAKDAFDLLKRKNRVVGISAYQIGSDCEINVLDNAGGIPDGVIERIFDPYFTTKEQGKGTGLGLYMSRRMVEEHLNGHLEVKNRASGACFTIKLEGVCHED